MSIGPAPQKRSRMRPETTSSQTENCRCSNCGRPGHWVREVA